MLKMHISLIYILPRGSSNLDDESGVAVFDNGAAAN